jgi:coenzyme F420-0:L-glutamate ligase/coenzyme F420-1:gamma-L-glutamate ligase
VPGACATKLAAEVCKDPRLVEVILSQSSEVVRHRKDVLVVAHRLGFVMANAGVDQSNVAPEGSECVLLLPEDPDESARSIKVRLDDEFGVNLGVVINDSFGRPWRQGVVGVALGAAGVPALRNLVGTPDLFGRKMRVTEVAIADEIASAASLLMGESDEGVPAVLVRGVVFRDEPVPASALIRPRELDMFDERLPAGSVRRHRRREARARPLPPDRSRSPITDLVVVNTARRRSSTSASASRPTSTRCVHLGGVADRERGWGRTGETWHFMESLRQLGGEDWFQLGDRDLAMHVERTRWLRAGKALDDFVAHAALALGISARILPMTNDRVRTIVETSEGTLPFQRYFVERRCVPVVRSLRFEVWWRCGSRARFPGGAVRPGNPAIVICPSNPY